MEGKTKEIEQSSSLGNGFYAKIYIVLALSLVIFTLYNVSQISAITGIYDDRIAEEKEAAKPAEIQLVSITIDDCKDCYDISPVISMIESAGVDIVNKKILDYSTDEAKTLIKKYEILSVPTVIVTGELRKAQSLMSRLKSSGEEKDGAYIFTDLRPPYVETSSGKVRGVISVKNLLKEGCEECINLSFSIDQFAEGGVTFGSIENIDVDSIEGQELIAKYNISKIPTLIMDQEAAVYPNIQDNWNKIGTIESDGHYVIRDLPPPYYSITEKRVIGIVSMTVVHDGTCEECYNASAFHLSVLNRLGVPISEEKTVDVSDPDGSALVEKYHIEKVPTIILEGDMERYPALAAAWNGVGTVESDGSYVFRSVELADKPYMDLLDSKVIDPKAKEPADAGNETTQ